MENVKLFISIPSNRDWKGRFGASLAALVSRLSQHGITSDNYRLENMHLGAYGQSSCLPTVRQKFVDEMIEGRFTHWLSLDDDMTFPDNIVDLLIAHDKDVVATNARKKEIKVNGCLMGMHGAILDSTGKRGLEEIAAMGGAIFLARIDSFKHIPKPHFQVLWLEQKQAYISEDIYFALLLKQNGLKLWCDHDATQLIGHVGDYEYKFESYDSMEEAARQIQEQTFLKIDQLQNAAMRKAIGV